MDYRQKVVVPLSQKFKQDEEDDDDDLEQLRLAALKSLKAKPTTGANNKQINVLAQSALSQASHGATGLPFNNQRTAGRRDYYYPPRPSRQNGNFFYRNNQNLIEIVPVEENTDLIKKNSTVSNPLPAKDSSDGSKFHRYEDNASGSEDDERETKLDTVEPLKSVKESKKIEETGTDKENRSESEEGTPRLEAEPDITENRDDHQEDDEEEEEEEEDKKVEDDDDVLLMADYEEEDSLERLMDEMEREMNDEKIPDVKEKKLSKKDVKSSKRTHESSKNHQTENHTDEKKDTTSSFRLLKNESKKVSPYSSNESFRKQRSQSPKQKLHRKSPRRSPPPLRQIKKFSRDVRQRSPRKLSPRYSPRPRSRSPIRRLSPRAKSPYSRSPLRQRKSRSPQALSRRSRSPRFTSRSSRLSPMRPSPDRLPPRARSPLPRSPRASPMRRSRSPLRKSRSPLRKSRSPPPRPRSPKLSRSSPHESPWLSPKNSSRLSPKRRRSPPPPPKESSRKRRSMSPVQNDSIKHRRDFSPPRKNVESTTDTSRPYDPVLEARKRKFESKKIIDGSYENKKIKLGKKVECTRRVSLEDVSPVREENCGGDDVDKDDDDNGGDDIVDEGDHIVAGDDENHQDDVDDKIDDDYDVPDTELSLHVNYDFCELEDVVSDDEMVDHVNVEMPVPIKVDKERTKKKKKKDKELYQIGKLKNDGGLTDRVVKEKKSKKKKTESVVEVVKETSVVEEQVDEETDLRTELSRRRAERLNRVGPLQSARLLQSAFKGVVKEAAKNNSKVNQRQIVKEDDKSPKKEIRRVTVLHRSVADLPDSEDETIDSKVPVRLRLGLNKAVQESRESKASRKTSKRQNRKVKHNNFSANDIERE